jgi:hypothetical protein
MNADKKALWFYRCSSVADNALPRPEQASAKLRFSGLF